MSSGTIIINGASGGAQNRLEINTFVKNDKFFSLYIQALQLMYTKTSQDDFRSFFQIGGIHGLPYLPWDNATGPAFDPRTQWGGYCTHGSVLFPTWHRPYVMLFEQVMQQHAKEVAATYTTADKADWVQAAENIRQPYWDWAANSVPPDQVIALKQVSITGPNGTKVTVNNPLFHYTFHPIDSSFPSPYRSWPSTIRQPTSVRPNATDSVARLKQILQSSQTDIRSSTYSMLTRVHTWTAFSNHTVGDGGSSSNSIEAIHDGIHVDVGGRGHMSDPSVAAFDPIFFLHHCNVDRMLSLWSALNPGVWVSQGDSEDGTFLLPPEDPVDANTPLSPFWVNDNSFWTSSATTDTATLGYTYPEFNGLDMSNANTVKTAIGNAVNRLYGNAIFSLASAGDATTSAFVAPTSASALAAAVPVEPKAAAKPLDAAAPPAVESERSAKVSHAPAPPHSVHAPHTGLVPPNVGLYEWTARVEFKKYELGSSFSVYVFLGSVPEDPEEWHVSPNFVGAHHAFVNTATEQCSNCRNHPDLVEEGFVHLNQAIVAHSGLGSLDPEVVEPYLTKELHWRVQKADGTEAHLDSLEVCIYGTPLSYPPGAMFPVPGHRRRVNGITRGRRGGARAT